NRSPDERGSTLGAGRCRWPGSARSKHPYVVRVVEKGGHDPARAVRPWPGWVCAGGPGAALTTERRSNRSSDARLEVTGHGWPDEEAYRAGRTVSFLISPELPR